MDDKKLYKKIRELRNQGYRYLDICNELGVTYNKVRIVLNPESVKRNAKDCQKRYVIKKKMEQMGEDFYKWQEKLGEHQ